MNLAYDPTTAPAFLKLLAHDLRWKVLTALARSDHRGQELIQLLNEPANLVSYHLKQLRNAQLVTERRSSADGRDVYYSLDLDMVRAAYLATGAALHPAMAEPTAQAISTVQPGAPPIARVLFLCTENSARSQMAEGIMRQLAHGRVDVSSAGSDPSQLNPAAVQALVPMGIDIRQQRSKHVDAFVGQSFDYIITVCDRVREECPVFPDHPECIHWSFPDPAAIADADERAHAFQRIASQLTTRSRYLLACIDRSKGAAE